MKKFILKCLFFLIMAVSFFACNRDPKKMSETTTRGNIKISVDESYYLLMEAEKYAFESYYTYAKINIDYKNEVDVFRDYMNDSVRLMVTNKPLTTEQVNYLKSKSIIARTTKIAYDALAFIINKNNMDSNILYEQIKGIFTGKISNWNQINPKSAAGKINVVFDNEKSGNVRYIKEKLDIKTNFPPNCFAVNNNREVINYVEKNPNAVGIISVNWISDKFDSQSKNFLNRIRVVEVGDIDNTDGTGNFCKPYMGYIADNSYPFVRMVYIISRETFAGLGTGFASFVAYDKGQRIILKAGLVPAAMPIRLVEVKH